MQHAVGQRIRELRLARSLTQEGVAELADTNAKYFGAIERGEVNVTLQTLKRIADALGVPAAELFGTPSAPATDREAVLELVNEVVRHADSEKLGRLKVFLERVFR